MSSTPAFSLTHSFHFLSFLVMPSIDLSMFLCATASLSLCLLVSDHVSEPYVIAGRITLFMIFLFKHTGVFISFSR